MANYESLIKRYKTQDVRKVFAHFPFNASEGENWETPFERLANMTKEGSTGWNFVKPEFRNKYAGQLYPILTNYLNYTFLRV